MDFICLLMIIAAPIIQVVFSVRRVKGKIKFSIGESAFFAFFSGIILSVAAAPLFISWLGDQGYKCVEGAIGLTVLGVLISIVATPIIATISYCIYRKRQPKTVVSKFEIKHTLLLQNYRRPNQN